MTIPLYPKTATVTAFRNSAKYVAEMALQFTNGGQCELFIAGHIFEFKFKVQQNCELYYELGAEGNALRC